MLPLSPFVACASPDQEDDSTSANALRSVDDDVYVRDCGIRAVYTDAVAGDFTWITKETGATLAPALRAVYDEAEFDSFGSFEVSGWGSIWVGTKALDRSVAFYDRKGDR